MSNDSMDPAEVADEAPHSVHIMILPLAWQLQIAGNHQIIVAVAALCQMLISVRMRKGVGFREYH